MGRNSSRNLSNNDGELILVTFQNFPLNFLLEKGQSSKKMWGKQEECGQDSKGQDKLETSTRDASFLKAGSVTSLNNWEGYESLILAMIVWLGLMAREAQSRMKNEEKKIKRIPYEWCRQAGQLLLEVTAQMKQEIRKKIRLGSTKKDRNIVLCSRGQKGGSSQILGRQRKDKCKRVELRPTQDREGKETKTESGAELLRNEMLSTAEKSADSQQWCRTKASWKKGEKDKEDSTLARMATGRHSNGWNSISYNWHDGGAGNANGGNINRRQR